MAAISLTAPTAGTFPVTVPTSGQSSTAYVWSYDDVYVTAVLAGRDAAEILVRDLGMTPSRAAADVSKWMVRGTGRLCAGG
jgi:hypothetical protein